MIKGKTLDRLSIQKMLAVVKTVKCERELCDTGVDYVRLPYTLDPSYAGYLVAFASDGSVLIPYVDFDVNAGYEQLLIEKIEADEEEVRSIVQACLEPMEEVCNTLRTEVLNA